MEQQYVRGEPSLRTQITGTSEVVVDESEVLPVGLVIAEGRRIIPLPVAFHRVERKVRTEEGDPKRKVEVSDPFLILKGHAVAATAEELRQDTRSAELMRRA